MSFADTYSHEVLQSRRDRSRRAFFWARIVGLGLMITIAAALRADPQLRSVLMTAGMDGVMRVADLKAGKTAPSKLPQGDALPTSRIKVNRPGVVEVGQDGTNSAALAQELGKQLAARRLGQ